MRCFQIIFAGVLLLGCGGGVSSLGAPLGSACNWNVDCAVGLTCYTGPDFPGGYCARLCEKGNCPDNGVCTSVNLCMKGCEDDSSCKSDENRCLATLDGKKVCASPKSRSPVFVAPGNGEDDAGGQDDDRSATGTDASRPDAR